MKQEYRKEVYRDNRLGKYFVGYQDGAGRIKDPVCEHGIWIKPAQDRVIDGYQYSRHLIMCSCYHSVSYVALSHSFSLICYKNVVTCIILNFYCPIDHYHYQSYFQS